MQCISLHEKYKNDSVRVSTVRHLRYEIQALRRKNANTDARRLHSDVRISRYPAKLDEAPVVIVKGSVGRACTGNYRLNEWE